MARGYLGLGSSIADGTNDPWAGVTKVEISSGNKSFVENTSLDTAGNRRTYQPGMSDVASVKIEYIYSADRFDRIQQLYETDPDTDIDFVVTLRDGGYVTFSGCVMSNDVKVSKADELTMCDVEIRETSDFFFTPTPASSLMFGDEA